MTDAQQRAAAKQFVKDWTGRGYEKGDSQPFCLDLFNWRLCWNHQLY